MVRVTEEELYCYMHRKSIKASIRHQQSLLNEVKSTLKYKAKAKTYMSKISKLDRSESSNLLVKTSYKHYSEQLELLNDIIKDNDKLKESIYAQLKIYYSQLNKANSFMKKVKVIKQK